MKTTAITQTRMVICDSEEDEAKKELDGKTHGKEEAYIVGSDSARRVTRHKLQLHVNLPKQIFIPGLEARARGLVKGEGEELSIVEYLGPAITPCDVKVLVEVACRGNNEHRQHQHKY